VIRVYPDDGQVPTKIHGLGTWFLLLRELLEVVTGKCNPKSL
jgi:hypothetical protein